jgi:Ca-activated chloride channel family protein
MSFQAPIYLLVLIAVPVVLAVYLVGGRRRSDVAARFASPALFPNVVNRSPGVRRHLPPAILLVALVALVVGLARPKAQVSVPRENATVMLAVDTSRSMAATDVEPSRMAAAQAALREFLAAAPEKYRIGLVAFATDARVVAPPTRDRELVRQALAQLRTGEGTALGDAIAKAVEVGRAAGQPLDENEPPIPTSVLVLSDGKQDGGGVSPQRAAEIARNRDVPVYTVALGTPDGVVEVPLAGGYRARVQVPPDPNTLRRISLLTGGRFFAVPTGAGLKAVYRDLASRVGHEREWREVTVAFAAAGVLLLLAGGTLSAIWFRRVP